MLHNDIYRKKIIKGFIENCSKNSDEGYSLEFDVQYPEKLHDLHNLPDRTKIEKIENLVANFHDKKEYAIHIRNLKQALNHWLVLKKVHRVIKLNKKTYKLKPYIDLNTELWKNAKK